MSPVLVSLTLIVAAFGRGATPFQSVVAGLYHTCALSVDGVAYCWGHPYGETPVVVGDGLAFESLTLRCGLTAAGSAYCWGDNRAGELGDGTNELRSGPVEVAGGLAFTSVSAGSHTCGVTTGGAAYCWGFNNGGRLGDGTFTNRSVPTPVAGGLTFESVTAGYSHSCGLTPAGRAYCWGMNGDGQLGDGTNNVSTVPVAVAGGLSFRMLSAGSNHVCGVTVEDAAYCWGGGGVVNLGDGAIPARTPYREPVAVTGGLSFRSVSAGTSHTCGVTTDDEAYCWGMGTGGMLGDGNDRGGSSVPVPVHGDLAFRSVSAGEYHTCGVSTSGEVYCWGMNSNMGRLGISVLQAAFSAVPIAVELPGH